LELVIARIAASLGEMLANHDVERIKSAPIPIAAGFSTIRRSQDEALVQRPHLRQPRPRAPCRAAQSKEPDEEISSVARPADESADLKLGILPAHEREKLVSRLLVVTEGTKHGAGDRLAMLLSTPRICMQRWRASIITPTPEERFFPRWSARSGWSCAPESAGGAQTC